jgi:hypothetical protein
MWERPLMVSGEKKGLSTFGPSGWSRLDIGHGEL